MNFRPNSAFYGLLIGLFVFVAYQPALASTGTIDTVNHYAWSNNGGYVNWYANGGNVTVTDTALSGYIWSAGFGWINLAPSQGGVINHAGTLSGYAWGANTGWINFAGVTIDSNGLFHGQTTPQSLFGTMTFDCTHCNVTTTWRSSGASPTVTTNSGGGTVEGPLSYGYLAGATPTTSPNTNSSQTASVAAASESFSNSSLTPTAPPPKAQPITAPPTNPAVVTETLAGVPTRALSQTLPIWKSAYPASVTPTASSVGSATFPPIESAPSCSSFWCWLWGLVFGFF